MEVGGSEGSVCGIAGVWSDTLAPAERERMVRAILSRMPERGPDAMNIVHCDELTLGFLRLSIVGGDGAAQPVETTQTLSMMNGEVYNYQELWENLPAEAKLTVGLASDCSVLAPLFEDDSLQFLERLDGIFAGVIYNRRQRTLLLFRDHVGIKPLFYAHRTDSFVFASTVAALRPVVSVELDRPAFRRYLVCGYVQTPSTLLRGIRAVRPGNMMSMCTPREKGIERTWFEHNTGKADVRQSIETAIRSEIPDGWPVVSTLSGGVDSDFLK
jgi:asparagine synthase (glutamine-hydrolysing)